MTQTVVDDATCPMCASKNTVITAQIRDARVDRECECGYEWRVWFGKRFTVSLLTNICIEKDRVV